MHLLVALLLAPVVDASALPATLSEPAVAAAQMTTAPDPISGRFLSEPSSTQPTFTADFGNCFSPFAFQLLLNTASQISSQISVQVVAQVSTGTQVVTVIILFVILGASILFLTLGEILVNTIVILATMISSFMGFLYLWQWACSSTVLPFEGFVKCWLPFVLAIICCLIVTGLVFYFVRRFVSLGFFIIGAAGGFFGMFLLRNFIISGNPTLVAEPLFNLYWLGAVAVAIICGFVAICLKDVVLVAATVTIGAYGLAMSICGLVPAFEGPFLPIWVFYVILGVAALFGVLFQVFVTRKCCKTRRENSRYRAHRKKQPQQGQSPGFDGVSMVRP